VNQLKRRNNMKTLNKKVLVCLLIAGFASQVAHADDLRKKKNFKEKHPRRAEVLKRANNEEKKNEEAEEQGKITNRQEKKLNREDQRIKKEEERDARAHGGMITKAEQNKLNREENRVNRERNNMEKEDAKKAVVPSASVAPSNQSN
jgi:biopolymer transport protein ExbB/TolQ